MPMDLSTGPISIPPASKPSVSLLFISKMVTMQDTRGSARTIRWQTPPSVSEMRRPARLKLCFNVLFIAGFTMLYGADLIGTAFDSCPDQSYHEGRRGAGRCAEDVVQLLVFCGNYVMKLQCKGDANYNGQGMTEVMEPMVTAVYTFEHLSIQCTVHENNSGKVFIRCNFP
ncbi:hypothetical protein VPNG_08161 [Cytospora leucostoma]|uniref:Uncharacterized protein n=1 Tax=Cytospora leucostoma TaxID=1230097 RepID=A0A423WID5_9PEZI|nr:hypothetical protein VPNG_08161 [Cytospora leucostoma]